MDERLAHIGAHLTAAARTLEATRDSAAAAILAAADLMIGRLQRGGKILICGNGGSAADAQHFAAELVVRLMRNRGAIAALALSTDTSILTAAGNDYGFDRIFARQVEALGAAGDVLVAISTSGRSASVLAAAETARAGGMMVVGLTGGDGGPLARLTDALVTVPDPDTQHIQEGHIAVIHLWCALIETAVRPA